MKWFLKVLSQYADFKGRACREEYWMYYLFCIIFGIVTSILDGLLGLNTIEGVGYGVITSICILALLVPSWAVSVRRLHDVGKSGWMFLIILIPIVGIIWLVVLLVADSQPGVNQYGANPKEKSAHSNLSGDY